MGKSVNFYFRSMALVGSLEMKNVEVGLLHRNCDICIPGDVNLVANLDLIEHSRISDTSVVFPSVRAGEGDGRCALSIPVIVAVIVLSKDAVPPGRSPCPAVELPVAVLTAASPGGFSLAETVLL